jgi:protein Mpv17
LESAVVDSAAEGIEAGDSESVVAEKVADNLAEKPGYVSLTQAQTLIAQAIEAARPSPPKVLKFLKSGEQELRVVNYSINAGLVGLSMFLAATQLGIPNSGIPGPSLFGAVKGLADQGWQSYEYFVDAHPIICKACISGTVYGLGDLTAQTYEGRSWQEFDMARILRSSACGFIAHGPLSHLYYEKLDRFFIVSKYFDGGDAWFAPLAKIAVDQTVWSVTWNSLYYILLGCMKLESPALILQTVRDSWWDLLKAGWRLWPLAHVLTYTVIPLQDRVLWVDMIELVWVTILSVYGQQRRERAGAVACALPGIAGEGGGFTDDILRGMTVENQIVFQSPDGEVVVKRLDEVMVEAAMLEAGLANSLDAASRYVQPIPVAASSNDAHKPGV